MSIGRLLLVSAYSIALLVIDALHFDQEVAWGIGTVAVLLWLAILADFVWGLVRSGDRKQQLWTHLGYPILLLAPLFVIPYWTAPLALALLVAYILELRQLTAGQGFAFSAVLVAFVAVVATWALVYSESKDPTSELGDWKSATLWTLANLLRMRSQGEPTTEDGEFVGYVLAVCALLVASLFTAQLVTWVIGSSREEERDREESIDQLTHQVAALRSAVEELNGRLEAGTQSSGTGTTSASRSVSSTTSAT